jgi:hypothetical protein
MSRADLRKNDDKSIEELMKADMALHRYHSACNLCLSGLADLPLSHLHRYNDMFALEEKI